MKSSSRSNDVLLEVSLSCRLEKFNIYRDHKLMESGAVTSIFFLTSIIPKKTFKSFRIQFGVIDTMIMNKTYTTENSKR